MNPGSVSIPKEESWHGYMIYENDIFLWKDLQGAEKMRFPRRKLQSRGRFNECGKDGKDIYGIEEAAKQHMKTIK